MSKGWGRGSTRRWRRFRAAVLAANLEQTGGRCQLALPGTWTTRDGQERRCLGRADCVHHPHGKAAGDTFNNAMAVCTPCNLKVGDPLAAPDPPPRPRTQW
ncbi:hypothetical protein ABGB07_43985 [Micromonosporaceae bacterium B7E4]